MPRERKVTKVTKSNLTETDKMMICDECGHFCPVFKTRGAVLDNLMYLAKCRKCGCLYRSEDGLHWEVQWQIKPEEPKDEK